MQCMTRANQKTPSLVSVVPWLVSGPALTSPIRHFLFVKFKAYILINCDLRIKFIADCLVGMSLGALVIYLG